MSNARSPWLTIVTLHKDDPPGLAATIDSVAQQDLDGVEHLLVESGDPEPYLEGPTWTLVRVQEQGIYPSMNASLPHIRGEYVLFLNAGDRLHDSGVLGDIRDPIASRGSTWAYGSVVLVPRTGAPRLQPRFDYASEFRARFCRGRFPMQPAILARASILRELGGFDESYRIAADYKLMLQLARQGEPLVLQRKITDFRLGGASSARWVESLAEARRARTDVLAPTTMDWIRDSGYGIVAHTQALTSRLLGRV